MGGVPVRSTVQARDDSGTSNASVAAPALFRNSFRVIAIGLLLPYVVSGFSRTITVRPDAQRSGRSGRYQGAFVCAIFAKVLDGLNNIRIDARKTRLSVCRSTNS